MRYLGGKYYVAKHIVKYINGHPGSVYLEPFMGSCWVTAKAKYKHRIAGDIHDELVSLFRKIQQGWEPPEFISEEEYNDIRANKRTDKYPPELIAFAGFGCAFGGSYFRQYAGDIYAGRSRRSILKKMKKLQDVRFYCADYKSLNPKGCIIYCDPPYEDSYRFRITKVVGNGSFDHKEFWDIMSRWSENNLVFISELEAPGGYECLMNVPIKASVRTKEGCSTRWEKLFCKNMDAELIQEDDVNVLDILGVPDGWDGFKG